MEDKKYFIIDFDSTFTQIEALDLLATISLKKSEDKDERINLIKELTNKGMNGEISLKESIKQRFAVLEANKSHLPELIRKLKKNVSPSFVRNKEFIKKHTEEIYIISNGFKDFIDPVVDSFGIKRSNVYANEFRYDSDGNIVGFDEDNLLTTNKGKAEQIKQLNLQGEIHVIGDGFTDFEIKSEGVANHFYAFTENVKRENVVKVADHEAPSLDEFLFANSLVRSHSYPKNRIKVLVLENIHTRAIEVFKNEGYQVEVYKDGSMSEEILCDAIKEVSILCIRSKTQVTQKVLQKANRLLVIGAFCIGVNQINLKECLSKGVSVFNAPFSNTRSVVELVIAEIILLMRNLPYKIKNMHTGKWVKTAEKSFEVRGKTLGIIGYGKIGSQLSVMAESIGLSVLYFDIEEKLALGNAIPCGTLQSLLKKSDIVSLHVDGRPENKEMIGAREIKLMKEGAVLINLSRGHVVDIDALTESILSGKIHGAGVDVYPQEPINNKELFSSPLTQLQNVILTPHIGGSTLEAQENIADFVPRKIMNYINTGSTSGSVNFPKVVLPKLFNAHRFIHIHHNEPGVMASINELLAQFKANVINQFLKSNDVIGYVITDIDKDYPNELIKALKKVPKTIRFRVLY